jgi:Secretion system C-terminal sorting domain/Beta-propeller repeat
MKIQTLILFMFLIVFGSVSLGQHLKWAANMGSSGDDWAYDIDTDSFGNVYVTGRFSGTVDFDPGPGIYNLNSFGGQDIFVVKVDKNGELLWARNFGNDGSEIGLALCADNNQNVYISGRFQDTVDFDPGPGIAQKISTGSFDIFLVRLDSNGNYVWAHNFGGVSEEGPETLLLDSNGDLVMTGYQIGTGDFDPSAGVTNLTAVGDADIFVMKMDTSGNFIWAKNFGGADNDLPHHSTLDANNKIYITGYFQGQADFDPSPGVYNLTPVGQYDVFVVKLNEDGNFTWARSIGSGSTDEGNSITVDQSNNVYIAGSFESQVDFDPGLNTNLIWSNGNRDIFLLKLDMNGNYVWVQTFGGTSGDEGRLVLSDEFNYIYLSGGYDGTVDFDSGPGVSQLSSAQPNEAFILKLDTTGLFQSVVSFGDGGGLIANAGVLAQYNYLYLSGSHSGTGDFDPGPDTYNLSSSGATQDIFVVKLFRCDTFDTSLTVSGTLLTANMSGATYQWIDCLTLSEIPDQVNQNYFTTDDGSYAVVITLDGCSDTSSCYVIDSGSGIKNSVKKFTVFPNPTTGLISIVLEGSELEYYIELIDTQGKLVYQSQLIYEPKVNIQLFVVPGVYFLHMQSLESIQWMQLIVK